MDEKDKKCPELLQSRRTIFYPFSYRSLLALGVDARESDRDSWTPLHYAAFYEHLDAMRALLNSGNANVSDGPVLKTGPHWVQTIIGAVQRVGAELYGVI